MRKSHTKGRLLRNEGVHVLPDLEAECGDEGVDAEENILHHQQLLLVLRVKQLHEL